MSRIAWLLLAGSFLLALPASAAAARPGGLDSTYGERGVRSLAAGAVTSSATAMATAPDGSAIVAGRAIRSGAERVLVSRLTPAGALDPGFAGGGPVLARFGADPGSPQRAGAVALQPDGKALVAGVARDNWFVARYTATGALDPSFGAGGVALLQVGGEEDERELGPAGIAVRPDGRILLVGTLPDPSDPAASSILLLGLLADGKRDPAVGGAGIVSSQLGLSSRRSPARSRALALALLPDGRALVAGSASDRTAAARIAAAQPVVARYLPNGRLDNSFGDRGKRVVAVVPNGVDVGSFEGISLAADGSIVVAGTVPRVRPEAIVVKLTSEGQLDERFARGGVARMQLGFGSIPATSDVVVAIDSAGRPVLSGQALAIDQLRSTAVVARLQPDGAVDCTFGRAGRARPFATGDADEPADSGAGAIVAGDALLVSGVRRNGRRTEAVVARFLGGAGTAPAAAPPTVSTGGSLVPSGSSKARLVGWVDPRCSTTRWAYEFGERALTRRTPWQTISAGAGPQEVCVTLRGLQPGRRYRARIVARSRGGRASGGVKAFTAERFDSARCPA